MVFGVQVRWERSKGVDYEVYKFPISMSIADRHQFVKLGAITRDQKIRVMLGEPSVRRAWGGASAGAQAKKKTAAQKAGYARSRAQHLKGHGVKTEQIVDRIMEELLEKFGSTWADTTIKRHMWTKPDTLSRRKAR